MFSQVPGEIKREVSSFLPARSLRRLAQASRGFSEIRPTFQQCCDILSLRDIATLTWGSSDVSYILSYHIREVYTYDSQPIWIYYDDTDIRRSNIRIITGPEDMYRLLQEKQWMLSEIIFGTLLDFIVPFLRKRTNCPQGFVERCWLRNFKYWYDYVEDKFGMALMLYHELSPEGQEKVITLLKQRNPDMWNEKDIEGSIDDITLHDPQVSDIIIDRLTVDDMRPDFFGRKL